MHSLNGRDLSAREGGGTSRWVDVGCAVAGLAFRLEKMEALARQRGAWVSSLQVVHIERLHQFSEW